MCNELNVPVVRMVVAFNLKEHRHTRGRHHKIVSFYLYSEGLKFETIFRNILYWNLYGLLLALILNSISFITFLRPPPFRFLKQKFLILQRLRINIFRNRDPPLEFTFVLKLYFLLMNVQEGL